MIKITKEEELIIDKNVICKGCNAIIELWQEVSFIEIASENTLKILKEYKLNKTSFEKILYTHIKKNCLNNDTNN